MKLPDLLPPNDLLKSVEGIESGLHQRQRLGVVGLVLAVLQIVVLIVNNEWFQGLTKINWRQLFTQRWGLLLVLTGVVAALILAAWSKFWLEESQAPFQASLVVLLVDPEIEEMLIDQLAFERGHSKISTLNEEKIALLRGAVREEVNSLPLSASLPAVLTLPEVRYLLRQLLEDEYPSMPVLPYDELSPDRNIQPIARISLG